MDELGQFIGQLAEPAVGLAQVGVGEVQAHEAGLGEGSTDLAQGAARAGGHIEHPQLASGPIGEGPQAPDQGLEDAPPHRIGGAIEQEFHLQVVEGGGVVAQVAVGLVVKVLQVVAGIVATVHRGRQIIHAALFAAVPNGWQIQPHQWVAAGPFQPGSIKEQGGGVDPLLRFLPVHIEQSLEGGLHGLQHLGWRRHRARGPLRSEGVHQPEADFLVGQPHQAFALLQGLVSQSGQGGCHRASPGPLLGPFQRIGRAVVALGPGLVGLAPAPAVQPAQTSPTSPASGHEL